MTPLDQTERVRLGPSQTTRKGILLVAIAAGVVFMLFGASRWIEGDWKHESIEWTGLGLIILCILGRTWCTLYIGGRKNQALVADGPYSVSRNPLYVFSIIGAAGVGAQVGSLVIALVCGVFAWMVFLWTARREEAALLVSFGDDFRQYVQRVPRFLPKLTLWRDVNTVEVRPQIVIATFIDALFFLVAVPIAEGIDYLHAAGLVPVLITLP